MESQELAKTKKDVVLFVLSSLVFGLVLSFLAWAIPSFIPQWFSPSYVLFGSIVLLLILGLIAFRLLVPPMKIQDTAQCYLAYDMEKNETLYSEMLNYDFWNIASMGFYELRTSKSEYKDALQHQLDLRGNLLKQFMIYSIVNWLTLLPATTLFASYRTKVPSPPRLYQDPNQKMRTIPYASYIGEVKNEFLELPFFKARSLSSIKLPRSIRLQLNENGVTLRNRYVTIMIGFQAYQQIAGVDLRIEKLLGLEKGKNRVMSISAVITFDAKPNAFWWMLPKANSYWNFAKETFENLKGHYDWGCLLDDVKETLTWKKLTEIEWGSVEPTLDPRNQSERREPSQGN